MGLGDRTENKKLKLLYNIQHIQIGMYFYGNGSKKIREKYKKGRILMKLYKR